MRAKKQRLKFGEMISYKANPCGYKKQTFFFLFLFFFFSFKQIIALIYHGFFKTA